MVVIVCNIGLANVLVMLACVLHHCLHKVTVQKGLHDIICNDLPSDTT